MDDPGSRSSDAQRDKTNSAVNDIEKELRTKHLKNLIADDVLIREQAVHELAKHGELAARVLVEALLSKSIPSNEVSSVAEALEEIGKPALDTIVSALDQNREITNADEAFKFESLIEILGNLNERRVAQPLVRQLPKLQQALQRSTDRALRDACESARVRIHRILSEDGERSALDDLLAILGDGRARVRDGIVEAVGRIGDERALLPLARLHEIEDDVSFAGAQQIRDSFREIVRRVNGKTEQTLRTLKAEDRALLEKIMPKLRSGGTSSPGNAPRS